MVVGFYYFLENFDILFLGNMLLRIEYFINEK